MNIDGALWLWTAHWMATVYMTGLIWFVQRVHYPLMNRVSPDRYTEFQRAHTIRTTGVVGPAMLIESFSAAALLYIRPDFLPFNAALLNFIAVLGIWISTAVWQVPCHAKLEHGFDAAIHRRLVRTNWLRSILWTARTAGLTALFLIFSI